MRDDSIAVTLMTLGAIFLASLATDLLGRRTRLPRVTLLLLLGLVVGPVGLDVLPEASRAWFPFIADLALVMVSFLLGGELTLALLRQHGRGVLVISIAVSLVTVGVVAAGLLAFGWSIPVALVLAAVATATDPAAVTDVVHEVEARGPFTRTLLGVVAIDDVWGIAAISIAIALVLGLEGTQVARVALLDGFIDLAGAVLLGFALGIPMALLTGRIRVGEPTLAEALGGVLLCGGLALYLDLSILLAPITMGVVVANVAHHHRRPFRAIEGIEWPFMILFFVLSGASLDTSELGDAAGLTAAYVVLRVLGRVAGAGLGARLAGPGQRADGFGVALLPQAGVAIGMALVASERVPGVGGIVLTATVAGTIVFELVGPILTRLALERSGEAHGE